MWMEEILHQLIGGLSHYLKRVSTINGGFNHWDTQMAGWFTMEHTI